MVIYALTIQSTPARLQAADPRALVRAQWLPQLAGRLGFRGYRLLVEPLGGQVVILTWWADGAALEASRGRLGRLRLPALAQRAPRGARYEVGDTLRVRPSAREQPPSSGVVPAPRFSAKDKAARGEGIPTGSDDPGGRE
jgi:hypothetical protein